MRQLAGKRILIVEDDHLSAWVLADHFRSARASILGPFATLEAAECHALGADLAVLDVNLRGQSVFPLADHLKRAQIPFVFYSGYDMAQIPSRFADVARLGKPCSTRDAVDLAATTLDQHDATVDDVLPRLRISARLMVSDPLAADRLVEATLLMALESDADLSRITSLAGWLHQLMAKALATRAHQLLN
ncbi:MAG: hypothetical protein LPJ95_10480 [Paracoccaceae bacterium]|nr:hypothetical protein [Paracoccaceae bacterium]